MICNSVLQSKGLSTLVMSMREQLSWNQEEYFYASLNTYMYVFNEAHTYTWLDQARVLSTLQARALDARLYLDLSSWTRRKSTEAFYSMAPLAGARYPGRAYRSSKPVGETN